MYTVYSKPGCGECDRAKALLSSRGIPYAERVIDVGQDKQDGVEYVTLAHVKEQFPQARSVPQFALHDQPLGGMREFMQSLQTVQA